MNTRERIATTMLIVSFGVAALTFMLWGMGLSLYSSMLFSSWLFWFPSLCYLLYRSIRHGRRLAMEQL